MPKTMTIRLEEEEIEMLKELQDKYLKKYGQEINQTKFFRKILREEYTRITHPPRTIDVSTYKDMSNKWV
ncbi:hypothetical protein [Priestia taiwanensis]|uniref:Uncharacterized protein n=1 Tax=Priestia taiwanensis TaxID=1347902 RepID=A0A917AWP1_9BACI|nr:hypothetical protein [Priestia taiwanensis]MBM7364426.1 hypothetical protein [Priestia taiwanensis]GGE81546.1 hypothetical protein GCM10007140_33930 [Priestia taiwanensis]